MDSPGPDNSELLRRARVDAGAYGAFSRRHAHAVYRSLLSDCGDPDVALDLTVETFARALRSIGRFRGVRVESGRAWIHAIAWVALPAVRARAPDRGPRAATPRDADKRASAQSRPRRRDPGHRTGARHHATGGDGAERVLFPDELTRRPAGIYTYAGCTFARRGDHADEHPVGTMDTAPPNTIPRLPGAFTPVEDTAA